MQRNRAARGQAIRASATVSGQCLDESLVFEAADGSVESSRLEADTGEILDVLGKGIPVLLSVSQARQNQRGRSCISAQRAQVVDHPVKVSTQTGIPSSVVFVSFTEVENRTRVSNVPRS